MIRYIKKLFAKTFDTNEEVSFVTIVITLLPIFVLLGFPFVLKTLLDL